MRTATISRTYLPNVTLGEMVMQDGVLTESIITLELPWKENKSQVSCIPEGEYEVSWEFSPSRKTHTYRVMNIVGRSGVLFHSANYTRQLKGCIAPCLSHADIDKDKIIDGLSSIVALNKLQDFFKKEKFKLIIKKA